MSKEPIITRLNYLQKQYPIGAIIELIKLEDRFSQLKTGTYGKIEYIDDIGQIHVIWETGSKLALIPGIDTFRVVERASTPKH